MELPTQKELDKHLAEVGYYDIRAKDCILFIAPRPHYCDRGSYLVNFKSFNYAKMTIDGADFFPHYFFGYDAMMSELTAWLKKRQQWA